MKLKKNLNRGAALVEYSILVGLITIGAVAAVATTGEKVADVYCETSEEMARVPGVDHQEDCSEAVEGSVELPSGERFVDAPLQIHGTFTDIMFEASQTGEAVIMSSFAEPPVESFWFDSAITSRNPHEPNRAISSCYLLDESTGPICSMAGANAAVSVPTSATAFGYAVDLSDNVQLPWQNDVQLSIPAKGAIVERQWDIDVSRTESDPVLEDVSAAFADHIYEPTDTGWTFGHFATLQGTFNRPLTFHMSHVSGTNYPQRACFVPRAEADPICQDGASIEVAPGAVSVGYEIDLPATDAGPDFVMEKGLSIAQDNQALSEAVVSITRPNAAYEDGTVDGQFTDQLMSANDTGWTDIQFLALEGVRNTELTMQAVAIHPYARRACYKTAEGVTDCGETKAGSQTASHAIPLEATEVGYQIQFPEPGVGQDLVLSHILSVFGENGDLVANAVEITRPNASYDDGSVTGEFTDQMMAQDDTGWTEIQFLPLEGARNTELEMKMVGYNPHGRRVCYKTAGNTTDCGQSTAGGSVGVSHDIPLEATEIGYQIQFPDEAAGPDLVFTHQLIVTGENGELLNNEVDITRPNTPYDDGSINGEFTDQTMSQGDTDWTDIQFLALEGARNTELEMQMTGNTPYGRRVCYKTAEGTADCGASRAGSAAVSHIIPLEATEVGYQIQLPEPGTGPDLVLNHRLIVTGENGEMLNNVVDITRPNEPYNDGSIDGEFTDQMMAQDDTGWTEIQFLPLEGARNTELEMQIMGSNPYGRRVCYKTAEGVTDCGGSIAGGSTGPSHNIPLDATEIGYQIQFPDTEVGPDLILTQRLIVTGENGELLNNVVDITRPNEPYDDGSIDGEFTDKTMDYDDAGWTDVQFLSLTGNRNTELTFQMSGRYNYARRVCYKTAGGNTDCGSGQSGITTVSHNIPLEATEIGYQIAFPDPSVGPDLIVSNSMTVTGKNGTLLQNTAQVTRPNEAYEDGSLNGNFTSKTMELDDTGWTDIQFLPLQGYRNTELLLQVSGYNAHPRKACFKTASGTTDCGDSKSSGQTASHTIPLEATEVGYQIQFPENEQGPDIVANHGIKLSGEVSTLTHDFVEIIRPNDAYQPGTVSGTFRDQTMPQGTQGWTDMEFLPFNGPRNINMQFAVAGGAPYESTACYKTSDGQMICQTDDSQAMFEIPEEATEIGYRINFPGPTSGSSLNLGYSLRVHGATGIIFDDNVQITRLN